TLRILLGERELNVDISHQALPNGGHFGLIRICGPVVFIQSSDLALDLSIRNVFGRGVEDNVNHDWNRRWPACECDHSGNHPPRNGAFEIKLSLTEAGIHFEES